MSRRASARSACGGHSSFIILHSAFLPRWLYCGFTLTFYPGFTLALLSHSEDFFVGFPGSVAIYLQTMASDLELLEAYARENSEESFAALVNRHRSEEHTSELQS